MTISLLQYNTHLFTGTVAARLGNTTYEDEKRRERIIDAIRRAPPDLVTLEEVWSAASQQALAGAFGLDLPFWQTDGDDTPINIGAGLVLLSRYPIETDPEPGDVALPAFTAFRDSAGSDSLARKGFLTVRIRPPQGAPFWVIHTHTQAGSDAADTAVRRKQFAQIRDTLDAIAQHFDEPTIFVGDLNVVGEAADGAATAEWSDLSARLGRRGLVDGFRTLHPDTASDPGPTYDGPGNALVRRFAPSDAKAVQRLDYTWATKGVVRSAAIDGSFVYSDPSDGAMTPLSDHYALRATLALG